MASDARPLRVLFLDLNAYFASVEQAERPELRGRPIAVVPVLADTTFVIAASYEAKAFGIRTGTRVDKARELCPEIELVLGRHALYAHYHDLVIQAVETVLPVHRVCSVDEMAFRLIGKERRRDEAERIARRLKSAIRQHVSPALACSIGIAPNQFLAKLATEFQKPDGLVVLEASDLPDALRGRRLTEFPGINRKMEARLKAHGVFTSDDLVERSELELRQAFGSVVGERWWGLIRGHELEADVRPQQSLGHSHVLPPRLRTDQGCRDVLLRLAEKAAARLRATGFWATHMSVHVGGKPGWHAETTLPPTQDSVTVTEHLLALWQGRAFASPLSCGVTFTGLVQAGYVTPSLFDETVPRAKLSHAVDRMNQRFGKHSVYLAGLGKAKDTAEERIAFHKTSLFSEGMGDNLWEGPDGG
jgi:DNA polymerase IV